MFVKSICYHTTHTTASCANNTQKRAHVVSYLHIEVEELAARVIEGCKVADSLHL